MLCVYGIVRAQHRLEGSRSGVQGGRVRLLRHEDVAALVSSLDDELLARRRDVRAHMSVLEDAFGRGPVLPFRFGTVVADEDTLLGVLAESAGRYAQLLDQLDGRVQMTVKAVRSDDETVRTVVASDDRLQRLVRRLGGSTVVTDQLELGSSIATAVERLAQRDADEITARLVPLAEASVAAEVTGSTVVSLALLMPGERLAALDRAVAGLQDTYQGRITFEYAGPMPPYSFVG